MWLIIENDSERICGSYALTLTEVDHRTLPDAYQKKLPKWFPGIRLGRLAVDQRYQGKRLGELLMMDAISRAQPGSSALWLH